MKTIQMCFRFKGNRGYIHGPDIFNEMLKEILNLYSKTLVKKIKLVIHSFASKQCELIVSDLNEELIKPDKIVAEITMDASDGMLSAYLVERDSPILMKYEFDESRIEALCEIVEEGSIRITGDIDYSPVEVAVSMTKQLHNRLFPPPCEDKWIVTCLELFSIFEGEGTRGLAIKLKHNFNKLLTKSEIFSGGELMGYIYFSLIKS